MSHSANTTRALSILLATLLLPAISSHYWNEFLPVIYESALRVKEKADRVLAPNERNKSEFRYTSS